MHGKGVYTWKNGKVKIALYDQNKWVKWLDVEPSKKKTKG